MEFNVKLYGVVCKDRTATSLLHGWIDLVTDGVLTFGNLLSSGLGQLDKLCDVFF